MACRARVQYLQATAHARLPLFDPSPFYSKRNPFPPPPPPPPPQVELRRVEQFGGDALVYCCGPRALALEVAALAHAAGVPFRGDSFEL